MMAAYNTTVEWEKSRRELLPHSVNPATMEALEVIMRNEFTAIFELDGDWTIAYCPEILGANGQGLTRDEARQNLSEAIALILEDRREDMMRGLPADADKDTVVVAA